MSGNRGNEDRSQRPTGAWTGQGRAYQSGGAIRGHDDRNRPQAPYQAGNPRYQGQQQRPAEGGGYRQEGGGYRQEGGGHRQERGGYRQERGGYRQERGGYEQGGHQQEGHGQGGHRQERSYRTEGASGGYGRSEPRQHQEQGGYRRDEERGRGGQGMHQDRGHQQQESRGSNRGGQRYDDRQQQGYNRQQQGYNRQQQGYERQQHGGDYRQERQQQQPYQQQSQRPQGPRPNKDGAGDTGSSVIDMMANLSIKRIGGKQVFLNGKRGLLEVGGEERSLVKKEVVTKGTSGQRITMKTNLFKFDMASGRNFNHYNIAFSPAVESTRLKRKLLSMLEQTLGIEGKYVTDGSSMFSSAEVTEGRDQEVVFREVHYKVDIRKVATVKTNSRHVVQVLNVIFGNLVQNNLGYKWDAGNYYDYAAKINIDGTSLSAYPGFFTSILNYEHGMRLMLDVSHKIITSQNAWEACGYDYRRARAKLIGKIVYTCYNGKTYKVEDVDVNKNIDHTFKFKGNMVSIRDYYKEKYGITPADARQPMLVVKPNRREERAGAPDVIYLVPEFCLITGIDEKDRSNRTLMGKLDMVTKPCPDARAKKMVDFASKLKNDATAIEVMGAFGIDFANTMDEVQARVLPPVMATQNMGSITRSPLLVARPVNKWIILHGNDIGGGDLNNFIGGVMGCMRQMGMNCRQPEVRQYQNVGDLQGKLAACPKDTDIVLILLRGNNKAEYNSAKLTLCVQNPIPSQVVTSFVAQKNKPAIYSKIALQINCKMGGAGWSIKNMSTKETMIVGVDTYHDSETRGSSYMGVVAAMNDLCTKYFTTWSKQDVGREVAVNFRALIGECMKAYATENGKAAKRIVIYRDGVGDGQLDYVINTEVKGVEDALVDLKWRNTGIAFIVVKKRVHARFFAEARGMYDNAPKGAVIDSVATRPNWMDFYLINQKANQGTLTPTHFNVLLNTTDLGIDAIQQLSYQQCFMYFNWTDSIRVPATCQYAHKVAFLIGQSLHRYPDGRLNNKLFYL